MARLGRGQPFAPIIRRIRFAAAASAAVLTAAGVGAASWVGRGSAASAWTAAGVGSAAFVGAARGQAVWSGAGVGAASWVGRSTAQAVWTAAGLGTFTAASPRSLVPRLLVLGAG